MDITMSVTSEGWRYPSSVSSPRRLMVGPYLYFLLVQSVSIWVGYKWPIQSLKLDCWDDLKHLCLYRCSLLDFVWWVYVSDRILWGSKSSIWTISILIFISRPIFAQNRGSYRCREGCSHPWSSHETNDVTWPISFVDWWQLRLLAVSARGMWPRGHVLCDHGLDLWHQLMWEVDASHPCRHLEMYKN